MPVSWLPDMRELVHRPWLHVNVQSRIEMDFMLTTCLRGMGALKDRHSTPVFGPRERIGRRTKKEVQLVHVAENGKGDGIQIIANQPSIVRE